MTFHNFGSKEPSELTGGFLLVLPFTNQLKALTIASGDKILDATRLMALSRKNDKQTTYQEHLERVSRSFAVCIAELDEPLREHVSLTYLLCRILDSVEDSAWASSEEQKSQFSELIHFFETPPSSGTVAAWVKKMPLDLPEGEKLLLADTHSLIQDYHEIPAEVRSILQGPLLTMARGMAAVLAKKTSRDLRLKNILELNHYCFFVAGVVGEILTRLVSHHYRPPMAPLKSLSAQILESLHFGMFLQKVNILKDQAEDTQRGFFFFESRAEVLRGLKTHALRAKDYLLALPETWQPYRIFCSFSLSLGLISLPFILGGPGLAQKISRGDTQKLLQHLRTIAQSNQQLGEFLQDCIEHIPSLDSEYTGPAVLSLNGTQESRFDPGDLYSGALSRQELSQHFSES